MKITVLGDGAWGSALACLLCGNGHNVTLWGPFPDYIEEMRLSRVNSRFLPALTFPEDVTLTADFNAAADADLALQATPTQYARNVARNFARALGSRRPPVVNVAKGIEVESLKRMSEIIADEAPGSSYAALSGPSHAEEVIHGTPTAVTVATLDKSLWPSLRDAFMNDNFRVYLSDDVTGVEIGGALKNVLAIAAGIVDGMKQGDNTKAAMVTRGVAEMTRLGVALGGKPETFAGLSGIGDLIVTCCSGHSRNRFVGERLGQGKKLDAILDEMGMVVAEGVKTAKSAKALADKVDVETPIINEVYRILYEDKSPAESLHDLMTRSPKPEVY